MVLPAESPLVISRTNGRDLECAHLKTGDAVAYRIRSAGTHDPCQPKVVSSRAAVPNPDTPVHCCTYSSACTFGPASTHDGRPTHDCGESNAYTHLIDATGLRRTYLEITAPIPFPASWVVVDSLGLCNCQAARVSQPSQQVVVPCIACVGLFRLDTYTSAIKPRRILTASCYVRPW